MAMIKDYLMKESKEHDNGQEGDASLMATNFLTHCQSVLLDHPETFQQIKLILSDFVQKFKQKAILPSTAGHPLYKNKKHLKPADRKENSEIYYHKYNNSNLKSTYQ